MAFGGDASGVIHLGFETGEEGAMAALAKLSLRVRLSGGGGGVFGVANTTWNEATITFSNAPEVGPLLVQMPTSSRDGTIAAQVTDAVQEDPDGDPPCPACGTAAPLVEGACSDCGCASTCGRAGAIQS